MTASGSPRILIVDDEPHICELLQHWLSAEGYQCATACNGEAALAMAISGEFHLILSDIMMPGMSGIDLLTRLGAVAPETAVVMITAIVDRDTAILALRLGAYGYSMKPLDRTEVVISVANALERRRAMLVMKRQEEDLEARVRERTAQVRHREEQLVLTLVAASEYRDNETGAHIQRVGLCAAAVAANLGWDPQSVDDIRIAAPMHDVGKIGIPDHILQKPGKLTREEFEVMKQHTEIGARILHNPEIPLLMLAREIALAHHEKWDGSGYPQGLAGQSIPESGRIVTVADVYDALVHDRVYRPALSEDEALSIIEKGRGKNFEPRILDCFLDLLTEVRRFRQEVPDPGPVLVPEAVCHW